MPLYELSFKCPNCQSEETRIISLRAPDPSMQRLTVKCQGCNDTVLRIGQLGTVYIAANNPKTCKISMTTQEVEDQVAQTNATSALKEKDYFKIVAVFRAKDPTADKKTVHSAKLIAPRRLRPLNKEHFAIPPAEAIWLVRSALKGRDPELIASKHLSRYKDIALEKVLKLPSNQEKEWLWDPERLRFVPQG